MSPWRLVAAFLYLLVITTFAATITYDWNITWVTANPDGMEDRPVIGINGQWPIPVLNVTLGDRIIANVHNSLGNEPASIHWHGLFQNGTNDMDGTPGSTQCEIPPGVTFTYNFTISQTGTYWYHSHVRGQYPDGFRQALLLADPQNPHSGQYDEERVITLSDWYHELMPALLNEFVSVTNPTGAEPVPKSALMNDTRDLEVGVQPGKTYLFHLVNVGAFASQYFWIEGHTMRIVQVDGVWTDAAETDMIYITAAQRYGVLVTTKNDTSQNYAMVGSMDKTLFDTVPPSTSCNVTGWLVYDSSEDNPAPAPVDQFRPYDDFNLVPSDGRKLYGDADQTVSLGITMKDLSNGANYAFLDDITYVKPKVPVLYTVQSTGPAATNITIYGKNTNGFILNKGDVIDIVLNNDDTGTHPFHLHGHQFQVIARGEENAGHFNAHNHRAFPSSPARRDTVYIRPLSNLVVRFVADNPGIWLFHCHIEWHMDVGLAATMIEAPLELQKTLTVPDNHYHVCKIGGQPTAGNAAGNVKDVYDLTGANTPPPPLPAGFTSRGIVALVFSCIAAVAGLASIVWYGLAPITGTQPARAEDVDENETK